VNEGENERRPQAADWIAALATVALLTTSLFVERGDSAPLKYIGLAVFVLAVVFIFGPFFHLSRHGQVEEGKSFVYTTAVVDRGLYAIVRHPQYLGYCLLALGFALVTQHPITLGLALIGIIFFYVQMVNEERFLSKQLGAEYEAYVQRVPRTNILLGIYRRFRSKAANRGER